MSNKTSSSNRGVVKFFNTEKGYGFITDSSSNADIFVHVTSLETQIAAGDTVLYNLGQGKKGPKAENVRKV